MNLTFPPFEWNFNAAEKKALKQVEKRIDQVWKKRLISGDPFEILLQEEKVGFISWISICITWFPHPFEWAVLKGLFKVP